MGISPVDCHTPLGFAMTRGIFLRSPKEHLPILRPCRGQCPHWPIKISCVVLDDVGIVPYKFHCTFSHQIVGGGASTPRKNFLRYCATGCRVVPLQVVIDTRDRDTWDRSFSVHKDKKRSRATCSVHFIFVYNPQ